MKRNFFVFLLSSVLSFTATAQITGGELTYDYDYSQGPFHHIIATLKLYKRCGSDQFPNSITISIFEKTSNIRLNDIPVPINNIKTIHSTSSNPCISSQDTLCYDVAYYPVPITLPFSTDHYILASTVNYRVNAISNLSPGYTNLGATYTADFPDFNESPIFSGSDLVILCANKYFSFSCAAQDARDVLRYSFCDAYASTSNVSGGGQPTGTPPFPVVLYNVPQFTGVNPLGMAVQIDSVTGIVSGIAPAAGMYLITVCLDETRSSPNVFSAKQRKDLLIKVTDCTIGTAPLLPFRDTLICVNDNLQLQASGSGNFSWSPPVNIINANTATPTVFPVTTTTYYVDLDDNGCITRDSVKVNVVDHVTLQAMGDTIICKADTIQLHAQSDGLHYTWSPAAQFIDPTVKNPFAFTNSTTNYQVVARIGGCSAADNVLVTTVPYPSVYAGADSTVCYNSPAWLHGITDGSSWQWSPGALFNNANLLNVITNPKQTTNYVLTVFDTKGCPKPASDTVKIIVVPKMHISAGRDTAVVTGQPLQLNATGGTAYTWSPIFNLSAANIPNPVALFFDPSAGTRYKVVAYAPDGCADSAYITIKVFKTLPTVFVPSAFTPNNDSRNDILRPIPVGIKSIDYFKIYNRWGQLLFSTTGTDGWNGKINGQLQPTGVFVWMVKASDYTGAAYFQKGIVTLIR